MRQWVNIMASHTIQKPHPYTRRLSLAQGDLRRHTLTRINDEDEELHDTMSRGSTMGMADILPVSSVMGRPLGSLRSATGTPSTDTDDDTFMGTRPAPSRLIMSLDSRYSLTRDGVSSLINRISSEVIHRPASETLDEDAETEIRHVPLMSDFHEVMCDFATSRAFSGLILFVILLNTAILISQTSQLASVRGGWYFAALDSVFLGIYVMEIVIKLWAWRLTFFDEGWNILDFTIVVCNLVDFILPLIIQNVGGFNGAAIFRILRIFRAIRAIRALRVLKTIRFLNTLQAIMTTLLQSIRSIGAIVILISLFMYMFAVVGRGLYAEADPYHFGNLVDSLFTLFQLLTLDDWFGIYKTVSAADPSRRHIIIYLLLYIVVEYFVFLNLFVAVLVDNFQLTLEAQSESNRKKKKLQQDSDDEGDDFNDNPVDSSSAVDISDDDDQSKPERKGCQEYYPHLSETERATIEHYMQLLTSLDYNSHILTNQHRVQDLMVDMCSVATDEVQT